MAEERPTSIAFIDIETTGLDPFRHELLEVAVVRANLHTLEIEAEYHSLIAPRWPHLATDEALKVNGFELERLRAAPLLEDVIPQVDLMLDGAVTAGHNVGFDLSFLEVARWRLHLHAPQLSYHRVDTVALSWVLHSLGESSGLSLDATTAALGIDRPRPHRAFADARAALEVARTFRHRMQLGNRVSRLSESDQTSLFGLLTPEAAS